MYKGFKAKLSNNSTLIEGGSEYQKNLGLRFLSEHSSEILKSISPKFNPGTSIHDEANDIEEEWFPQIEADVFISHSHDDYDLAARFAGWLNDNFGLVPFLDHSLWGNSEELLKVVDDHHSKRDDGLYDYGIRNKTTAHVYMMLATSLHKMIDKTECLFFLNTPNSIDTDYKTEKTRSPWIYSELMTSSIVRKKLRRPVKGRSIESFRKSDEAPSFDYKVDTEHLDPIGEQWLLKWKAYYEESTDTHPLDVLYSLYSAGKTRTLHG